MVRTIKSVLLFDYDGLFRSVGRHGAAVAEQIGSRAGAWLEALETGELMGGGPDEPRRRFQMKRCYADPRILGKSRGWLSANGVQIADCPIPPGLARSAGAVQLVLDALDALDGSPEEIIVLVPDIDLTPLLFRLKAMQIRVVTYAADGVAETYRALADGVVDEGRLIAALERASAPAPATAKGGIPRPPRLATTSAPAVVPPRRTAPVPAAAPPPPPSRRMPEPLAPSATPARTGVPINRDDLASLVRRINQETGVPLFSPKGFNDLFRLLVEDVALNGYKFQSTADNVAMALNELGRNVTKRQVGFIIKGLALRGHVFSPDDRPDDLAESFYDQVLFLAENANLELTEAQEELILAWIVGVRRPVEVEVAPPPPPPAPPRVASRMTPPRPAAPPARRREPEIPPPPPSAAFRRTDIVPARPQRAAAPAPVRPAPPEPEPPTEPPRQTARASFQQRATQNNSLRVPAPRKEQAAAPANDLEDSILSAIADAVDVLVEEPVSRPEPVIVTAPPPPPIETGPLPMPPPRGMIRTPVAPTEVPTVRAPSRELPPADMPAESDEIGDEIQRILSSYNEKR